MAGIVPSTIRRTAAVAIASLICLCGCDTGASVHHDPPAVRVASGVPREALGFHYTLDVVASSVQPTLSDLLSIVQLSGNYRARLVGAAGMTSPSSARPNIVSIELSKRFFSSTQAYKLAGVTIGLPPKILQSSFRSAASSLMQAGYYVVLVRMTVPMGALSVWKLDSLNLKVLAGNRIFLVREPGAVSLRRI